jgi:hypothetical protein
MGAGDDEKNNINDRIIAVTQDCNTTDFKGDRILVINTSCNDVVNEGWFDTHTTGCSSGLRRA